MLLGASVIVTPVASNTPSPSGSTIVPPAVSTLLGSLPSANAKLNVAAWAPVAVSAIAQATIIDFINTYSHWHNAYWAVPLVSIEAIPQVNLTLYFSSSDDHSFLGVAVAEVVE